MEFWELVWDIGFFQETLETLSSRPTETPSKPLLLPPKVGLEFQATKPFPKQATKPQWLPHMGNLGEDILYKPYYTKLPTKHSSPVIHQVNNLSQDKGNSGEPCVNGLGVSWSPSMCRQNEASALLLGRSGCLRILRQHQCNNVVGSFTEANGSNLPFRVSTSSMLSILECLPQSNVCF